MIIFKRLKQLLCRHEFKFQGKNKFINEDLWFCPKCRMYYIRNLGLGMGYKTRRVNFDSYL